MAEDAPELGGLRRQYPGWQFWPRLEGGGYAARRFRAPTAEEPLHATTVDQLAAEVAESESYRREAQAYVDAVSRGMRAYFAARAMRTVARKNAAKRNAAALNAVRQDREQNALGKDAAEPNPAGKDTPPDSPPREESLRSR